MRPSLLACAAAACLAGCCTAGPRHSLRVAARAPGPGPKAVAFVANGSGDFRTVSANLSCVAAGEAAPLEVVTVLWSHGLGRYVIDHTDHRNQVARGAQLAAEVAAYRRAHPERRVSLVGHSAGCAVVLAAAERSAPGVIDRVVLLAPSVGASYDLRPALRASGGGIDVFYSGEDRLILGLCMYIVGTADRRGAPAAGRCGFAPVGATAADAALYAKLRQHAWAPGQASAGHGGGHYGSNRPGFLRARVLPLLVE